MAENLNFAAEGSRCYNDSTTYCEKYGRLYNWGTAMKACPSGWHLPSDTEWNVLMKFVNPSCSDNRDCVNAGTKLKATSGWNRNSNGEDTYGFAALPGGSSSDFDNVGNYGYWWSASEYKYSANSAYSRGMSYGNEYVYGDFGNKSNDLLSVRCLQD